MGADTKFAAWSCPHVPLQCNDTFKWTLDKLSSHKPDVVVMLGDLLEADAASIHPSDDNVEWDLNREFQTAAGYLQLVRDTCGPDATYVFLHGNHDDNILRADPRRIPKKLRALCDFHNHIALGGELKYWKEISYGHEAVYRLGPVTFQHGSEHGINSDRDQCQLYAPENGLYICGHTHRPKVVQPAMMTARIPLKKWFANAGCQVDWSKLSYMDRKNKAAWGHGLVLGSANSAHRRSHFATVQWEAQCHIKDMGWM